MEPIQIADIPRNKTEIIRIEITEYREKKLLNIRTWYENEEGNYAPTKKGVAIPIENFDQLYQAIAKAKETIEGLQ